MFSNFSPQILIWNSVYGQPDRDRKKDFRRGEQLINQADNKPFR